MSAKNEPGDQQGTMRTRPLEASDLEAVVALDKRLVGRSRRGYFEKRLAAALRDPSAHIQVAVTDGSGLIGVALARVLHGEFGRPGTAVLLETIDVDAECQSRGAGRMLIEALEEVMRKKGIHELQTQASWTQHDLLRFFDRSGFKAAPRHIVSCPVSRAASL